MVGEVDSTKATVCINISRPIDYHQTLATQIVLFLNTIRVSFEANLI